MSERQGPSISLTIIGVPARGTGKDRLLARVEELITKVGTLLGRRTGDRQRRGNVIDCTIEVGPGGGIYKSI
jgi:hypothetical protein